MVQLKVNGQIHRLDIDPQMPLLWALRDVLELTGTKYSCGIGECGSCTVHIDGRPMLSCRTSVGSVGDREVTTIEGLSHEGRHPLLKAWSELNVSQCGYCQPGQIMSAAALLAENPAPSDTDIDEAMSGNICRCGTYARIREAIHQAGLAMREDRS